MRGRLQHGKIVGPKLFAPTPPLRDSVKLYVAYQDFFSKVSV